MEKNAGLQVTLITGRTIEQGVGKEQGKGSNEYMDAVAICYFDPEDLKKLQIEANSNVKISTEYGSVVVKAKSSLRTPHSGIAYMPYGPWANAVVNPETNSIGMPSLKGIPAIAQPALEKPVQSLKELLNDQFRKGQT
jgi:formylmethanofuran dehydrogenase subunit D